ncbi:MAG: hypothetical protein LC730_06980, partial [Acidobacteria bacterium]|nr:hypothetical protein [Acidobacteriota bacterium]
PQDTHLLDSELVLKELAATISVSHNIERAERAAFKGNKKRAISLYQDVLFEIERNAAGAPNAAELAAHVQNEIEKLNVQELTPGSSGQKTGQ